jgi:hypothetical protein
MAFLSFIPGLITLFFHLQSFKSVKCRHYMLYYRAAVVKSCVLRFTIPFKCLKIVNAEVCIHISFWCFLFTVEHVTYLRLTFFTHYFVLFYTTLNTSHTCKTLSTKRLQYYYFLINFVSPCKSNLLILIHEEMIILIRKDNIWHYLIEHFLSFSLVRRVSSNEENQNIMASHCSAKYALRFNPVLTLMGSFKVCC